MYIPEFGDLLTVLCCLATCHRLLLILICWYLKRAINIDVEIQGLGFFSVHGIKISLLQRTLDIKNVSLRFSNAGRKGLRILVDGLSIVEDKYAVVNNSPNLGHLRNEVNLQISPGLVAMTQWIEVEVCDLKIHSELAGQRLLCSSTSKLDLYFLGHDVKECLIAKANLYTTTVAVCPTPPTVKSSVRGLLPAKHELMLSWNTSIVATASLTDSTFSLQKLSVEVDGLDVEIKENISTMIYGKCQEEIATDLHFSKQYTKSISPVAKQSFKDSLLHFSPFIPKDFHLGIHDVEMSGMKGSPSPYTISINCCSLDLFNILGKPGSQDGLALNPHPSIIFCISDVEMEINLLETIKIEEFSVDCQVKNNVLKPNVILKSVAVFYHHEELMKWLQVNFRKHSLNKHNSNISALGNNTCADYGYGKLLSVGNVTVQMSQFTAKYFLSPREVLEAASLDVNFVKLKYEKPQGLGTDELALDEIIVKNLWCHLGRMPFDQIYRKDKHHTWGAPLFIQLLRVKKPGPGIHSSPVDVHLSSVEVEWTPRLSHVALGALRCLVDFQKTISDLREQEVVEKKANGGQLSNSTQIIASEKLRKIFKGQQLSSYHQSSSINLTMFDCNVYLLDDLVAKDSTKVDLCYMLRFDTIMYQSSPEKICFDVEGLKAVTILQERTGQHACATCEALKGYWLYVKSLHGVSHQPFGEMMVRLNKKIELFWNQDLHSRISGMTSSVQDFYKSVCEVYYQSQPNSQRNAECSMSLTIGIDCQAKVVVDLCQSITQLHVFFSEATYISTGSEKCIKAYVTNVQFLKGAFFGVNAASLCAAYNQLSKGYIHHTQSNTSLFLSLDPKIEQSLMSEFFCLILALFF